MQRFDALGITVHRRFSATVTDNSNIVLYCVIVRWSASYIGRRVVTVGKAYSPYSGNINHSIFISGLQHITLTYLIFLISIELMAETSHAQKTALVTGAGGGLGRAIAERFLSEGANIVICDINQTLIDDFNEKVSKAYPERTLVLNADITSEAALDDLFAKAKSTFGGLDYVVNSAGIMDTFGPAGEVDKQILERVLAVNLMAPMMITKRAVNEWSASGKKGSIVNIASVAGVRGFCGGKTYAISS